MIKEKGGRGGNYSLQGNGHIKETPGSNTAARTSEGDIEEFISKVEDELSTYQSRYQLPEDAIKILRRLKRETGVAVLGERIRSGREYARRLKIEEGKNAWVASRLLKITEDYEVNP